jgi:sugar phosphate isomerase/epimerase
VWLAVEPINRYEDFMVNWPEEAAGLADGSSGRPSWLGRVCADLFHEHRGGRLAAAIRAAGPRIAHVHVDDTNRLQPGTGYMDFAACSPPRARSAATAG